MALDGLPIDLYLIHAPDPATPWKTSVRALARLVDEGLVKRVGVANVNRRQLDEALELAPITAVQVALSVYDDSAVRGGVVERCEDAGVAIIAHSPLGGTHRGRPARARRPGRGCARLAASALAAPSSRFPVRVAPRRPHFLPRRAATAPRSNDDADRPRLAADRDSSTNLRSPFARRFEQRREYVLVIDVPGAGRTTSREEYSANGYHAAGP